MKRDILCQRCADTFRKVRIDPEESTRLVDGTVLNPCLCDVCGSGIDAEQPASARSIWLPRYGQEYYEWEHEYLKLRERL